MANRNNVLERFSSKYKSQRGFRDENGNGGNKKRRPNFDKQRQVKQAQWEDKKEDEE